MLAIGLDNSFHHRENGMTRSDMVACIATAEFLNEVIIFRSTGPWSQRWIERNYPTKNFHVKGKSSDWGPQAGFVPYLGEYSKVGSDTKEGREKSKKATEANIDGLKHKYAQKTQLCLTEEEIMIQCTRYAGTPARLAIHWIERISGTRDYLMMARRTSDQKEFAFRGVWSMGDNHYKIWVYPRAFMAMDTQPEVFEVMTSSEVGADNKPLTGDYDLMAVCPTWASYGARSVEVISKDGVNFGRVGGAEKGMSFAVGSNLDAVLDMRTNTGLRTVTSPDGKVRTFGKSGFGAGDYGKLGGTLSKEHDDMGNITPRILRCINALNTRMGQSGAFRRVHHNAESHRNTIFGGITGPEMQKGEAFPLTVFQPPSAFNHPMVSRYQNVCTLENLDEFKEYAVLLHQAGFYLPRSWSWGMSIRDRFR